MNYQTTTIMPENEFSGLIYLHKVLYRAQFIERGASKHTSYHHHPVLVSYRYNGGLNYGSTVIITICSVN